MIGANIGIMEKQMETILNFSKTSGVLPMIPIHPRPPVVRATPPKSHNTAHLGRKLRDLHIL